MIIAFANQKGGVGKTTLAVHTAAHLVDQFYSVLLIDADPQGNATSWITNTLDRSGLHELLIQQTPPRQCTALPTWQFDKTQHLTVMPSNHATADAYATFTAQPIHAIAQALQPLTALWDYTLIDMPPSRSPSFLQLLCASDLVVVPTKLERLSVEGITLTAQAARSIKHTHNRREPKLLAIVPNLVRRTKEHSHHLNQLLQVFGPTVYPPIPLSTRVPEACSFGQTLFAHAPRANVTAAMRLTTQRIITNSRDAP